MNETLNLTDPGESAAAQTPEKVDGATEPRSGAETPAAKKTILLADDDPGVREMLGRVLETEHYQVMHAKTGLEAATRFLSGPPDLVLLDLNMPEKDGWEAFSMMCEKNPLIPVIVITARPGQLPTAIELGIDAFMEKPLNLHLLLETIRNLLAETEPQRVLRLTDATFKTRYLSHLETRPATTTRP